MTARNEHEDKAARKRAAPSGHVVYQAILRQGEDELTRSTSALFWSGIAAGLSMSFSVISEALLRHYLPEAQWQPLVTKLGYSVGFLIVILGRQQLFTENTLTPILPLLLHKNFHTLWNVARLWVSVLSANLIGCLVIAAVLAHTKVLEHETRNAIFDIAKDAMSPDRMTILGRGVVAGWLIALMVWLLPFSESSRVLVIIIMTYVVGLGHFSHIIAGAIPGFFVALLGQATWWQLIGDYLLPILVGNILGGVTLVAAINHAQVVSGTHESELQ